jgi:hypothetical protein
MATGLRLEDLEADLLFNVAMAELYRHAELSAEAHFARSQVELAILKATQPVEEPAIPDWGIPTADQLGPQMDLSNIPTGRQMGSFDDLVLNEPLL